MKVIEKSRGLISYQVNPYTELLGVISIIADESELYKKAGDEYFNKNYRDQILSSFASLKNHRAVLLLTGYADIYQFNYDAPCALFLELADNNQVFSSYIREERLPISQEELKEFTGEIYNFLEDSGFEDFYLQNKKRYRRSIDGFIERTKDCSPAEFLFSLIGEKRGTFAINLMHSVTNSNYGLTNKKSHYICLAPSGPSLIKGEPDFAFSLPNTMSLILHELAHGYINPLTRKHSNHLKKIDKEVFKEVFKNNPYGNSLETAINESIIRSIECLYIKRLFPQDFESFLNKNLSRGFKHIPKLLVLLEDYEKEKGVSDSLDGLYPELLNTFLSIS